MAYMDQTKKAKIAAELKKVMPKDWKYTLRVHHHSSITMTITSAPVDLFTLCSYESKHDGYIQLNEYYLENAYDDQEIVKVLKAAKSALNTDNYDRSDIQTDYFCVGHYVHIHVGGFNRPFVVKGSPTPAAPVTPVTTSQEPIQETVTTEATVSQENSDDNLTPDELLTAAQSLWKDACEFESINPDSKFVCFSKNNKFAEFYGIAMSRYFEALKAGVR